MFDTAARSPHHEPQSFKLPVSASAAASLAAARLQDRQSPVTAASPLFDLTDPFVDAAVPAVAAPCSAAHTELPTPSPDYQYLAALDLTANSFFPPVAKLSPPLSKLARGLHLPPFDLGGIAVPHPDRVLSPSENPFSAVGCGPLSKPDDPLHACSPAMSRVSILGGISDVPAHSPDAPGAMAGHVPTFIPTITPPIETGPILWGHPSHVKTATSDPPATTDPNLASSPMGQSSPAPATTPASDAPVFASSCEDKLWIQVAKSALLESVGSIQGTSIKVLSHALPCPSRDGHAFPTIIDAIHRTTPTIPTTWINVFHAVPGRFKLDDIPTSPPSTPGPYAGGEDYFTSKVFDSAVSVSDYQGDSKYVPPSPQPVVPPSSVDVSIVERYIPPTNVHEFAELFLFTGRSILMDRLVELSSTGSLLFIYPTKTGGRTFMKEYVGPILDPLLRTMTVVNDLSANLGQNLGNMESVNHLVDFTVLESKIRRFCATLSRDTRMMDKFHSGKASFSVVHASRQEVVLPRDVWSRDWWVKQEKPRVRDAVAKYFRIAHKLPADAETMPTNLIQEILNGVTTKAYEHGEPERGVEVGVFVIRKSEGRLG